MVDRIKKIIDEKKLSSTQFADAIDVQRSSLSHVLSGRNKPSLDFMLKIKNSFPEINLDWLLLGEGSMRGQVEKNTADLPNQDITKLDLTDSKMGEVKKENERKVNQVTDIPINFNDENTVSKNPIRVIMFYHDNTFESFDIRQ